MKSVKNNVETDKILTKKFVNKGEKRKKIRVHSRTYYNIKTIILCLISVLSILALGVLLSANLLFKISKIDVIGESTYSYDEIVKAVGIREGDNLFTCDLFKGQRDIERALPYADKVKIDRNIPNKLSIRVETAVPKFVLEHDGKYILISDNGKIFDIVEIMPGDLIELKGAQLKTYDLCEKVDYVEPDAKEKIDKIIQSTSENQFNLTKIDVSNLYNLSIKYDNRVEVLLGTSEEIDYKIVTANEILCNKLRKEDKGKLDLSSLKLDGRSYFTPEYIMN